MNPSVAQPVDPEKAIADLANQTSASSTASSGEHHASASGSSDDEKHHQNPEKPKKSSDNSETDLDPLAHLPQHERDVLKKQLDVPALKINFRTLFRYATRNDLLIIAISSICGIAAGAVMPLMTIIFGQLAGVFQQFFLGQLSGDDFTSQLGHFTVYYVYLAIGEFVTVYISTVGFIYSGEHISQKIREQYLAAILRQNVGFFDKLGAGEITTRITADTNLVQDGISEKIGLTLTAIATFVTAFVIAFIKSWLLTVILLATVVAIVVVSGLTGKNMTLWSKMSLQAYAVGGTVAEEVLSSIRNAVAFGTEDKLAKQYDAHLDVAEYWAKRSKGTMGLMLGCLMCIIFLNYGLAFWQGSRFLVAGTNGITLQDILTILLAIMIGAFSLGNVAPNIQAFIQSVAAGQKIFATIDRVSPIDPSNQTEGAKLDAVEGTLALKNVKHIYPSRPEVVVMEDVSLDIPAEKTTALVGASGSGKSTIVGLALRLYDPVGGQVFLDGVDVREMNVQFLRRQISLVGQEPTLFSTTIFENICHGLIGTEHESLSDEKKMDLVVDAAKMANAHSFILELPEGYQTNVGQKGFLLSGGQKQRIAIARAVVSDPKILLLDEATSALDTRSEGVVQAALDKAAQGRTTITVAHRLSTIKHADNIVVMAEGRVVEQGTHDELLEREGAYYNLVEAQQIAAATKTSQFAEEEEEVLDLEKEASELRQVNSTKAQLTRTQTANSVSRAVLDKGSDEEAATDKGHQYSLWQLFKLTASLNRPEWGVMIFGLISSIIAGAGQPVQSVFFAKSIVALSRPPSQYRQLRSDINFWALMYLMLAFVQLISHSGQGVAFAYASEKLIHRARDKAFRAMLRQDISFFDKEENSAGALTTFLSTETTNLAGISGITLGTILNVLTTLIASFALSIAIGWKLALVCIATVPVVLLCGFFRFWVLGRFSQRVKSAYASSAAYACEATSAIRTVASLTREQDVWDHYHGQLEDQARKSLRSVSKTSILYAASQSLMFLAIALGFWYGGKLIGEGEYGMFQFFVCFSAVIFGAQSAGTIFSFAPDMSKSRGAASEIKNLLEREPAIDTWSTAGTVPENVQGLVEFRNVHFRYATRPEVPVLRGIDFTVKPGEYVALVGASGCGKSTAVGLVERFYDPLDGSISVDGTDIRDLNLNAYRSHIALVSQEPTLYQGTIRDNILLGAASAADESLITDEQLETACRNANIWNFVSSLPDGLNTDLGNKGVMLSGGQKQRVAIARALLRDPKVLLLDEATSALDSESEKVVQAALDQAAKGRTTISIAHRLSTIQRADRIYVFEGGRVVESGRHQQLLAKKGRYFELVQMQSLEKTA